MKPGDEGEPLPEGWQFSAASIGRKRREADLSRDPSWKMRNRYETPPEKRAQRDEEVKDRLRAMFGRRQ